MPDGVGGLDVPNMTEVDRREEPAAVGFEAEVDGFGKAHAQNPIGGVLSREYDLFSDDGQEDERLMGMGFSEDEEEERHNVSDPLQQWQLLTNDTTKVDIDLLVAAKKTASIREEKADNVGQNDKQKKRMSSFIEKSKKMNRLPLNFHKEQPLLWDELVKLGEISIPPLIICGVNVDTFGVLKPSNQYLAKWDIVVALCLLYVTLVTPLDVSFSKPSFGGLFFLNRVIDIIFVIDMILTFNIGVYSGKEPPYTQAAHLAKDQFDRLLVSRREIVWSYLKGWFVADFVSVIPYDVIILLAASESGDGGGAEHMRMLRLVRLLKLLRLARSDRLFARIEARFAINYSVLQLALYLVGLFTLCHWMACGWHLIIEFEANTQCEWTTHYDEKEQVWVDNCCLNWLECFPHSRKASGDNIGRKYFLAMMWSSGQVLTVGSSISAVTDGERAYTLMCRLLSGIVYAYLIGAVCSIFAAMQREQNQFFQTMDSLNTFIARKHLTMIDPELCGHLRLYFRFAHKTTEGAVQLDSILNRLSPLLRGQLLLRVHRRWMLTMELFRDMDVPDSFWVNLASSLEFRLFSPFEMVIQPHDSLEEVLVIEKGIVLSPPRKYVKTSNCVFGEDALCAWRNNLQRGYQATAITHGSLYVLKVDAVFSLLCTRQYAALEKITRSQLVRGRCRHLIFFYSKAMHWSAKATQMGKYLDDQITLERAVAMLRRKLDFLSPRQFRSIVQMHFRKIFFEYNPGAMEFHKEEYTAHRHSTTSFVNKVIKKQGRTMMTNQVALEAILVPFDLQNIATKLLKEDIDAETIYDLSVTELHNCGAPLNKAVRFVNWHRQTGTARNASGDHVSTGGTRTDAIVLRAVRDLLTHAGNSAVGTTVTATAPSPASAAASRGRGLFSRGSKGNPDEGAADMKDDSRITISVQVSIPQSVRDTILTNPQSPGSQDLLRASGL